MRLKLAQYNVQSKPSKKTKTKPSDIKKWDGRWGWVGEGARSRTIAFFLLVALQVTVHLLDLYHMVSYSVLLQGISNLIFNASELRRSYQGEIQFIKSQVKV